MRNLRLAFRTLAKSPFVTAIAVLSLALGIGANAAIFSAFDQMLLSPLPVNEPEHLANLGAPSTSLRGSSPASRSSRRRPRSTSSIIPSSTTSRRRGRQG